VRTFSTNWTTRSSAPSRERAALERRDTRADAHRGSGAHADVYLHIVLPEAPGIRPLLERHATNTRRGAPPVEMGRYILAEDYCARCSALALRRAVDRALRARRADPPALRSAPSARRLSVRWQGTEPVRAIMLRLTQLFT